VRILSAPRNPPWRDADVPPDPPHRIPRTLVVLLWLTLAGSLANFAIANSSWFLPFTRDFSSWVIHPSMAGGPVLPAEWFEGALLFVAAGIIGWQLAATMLHSTRLVASRRATVGLALMLGPCTLGFIAVLAEISGLLYAWLLVLVLVAVLAVTTFVWRRVRAHASPQEKAESLTTPREHWAEVALWTVVVAVVTFAFLHVAMSPVTEWDAIVYHASVAKLWFLGRPHPALLYGPSVGVEISDNYPPLFPATGAFFYVALNHFDDFYLRVIPPIIFLGTLLLSYGYAAVRYGRSTGRWTVLLMLGCPLLVMYGAWPTAYIYLTALTTAGIILIDFAVESAGFKLWLYAGLVTGLACLTHFFGLVVVVIGVLAFFIFRRWRTRYDLRCMAVYLGGTLAVVGPWYLRNAVLLGDPIYPLLSPPLHAKGLIQPIWNDSQAEIRNNALGQWLTTPVKHIGLGLRLRELESALFNRNLLPIGVLLAILAGLWLARKGERRALFLLISVCLLIGVQLVPGWYWWRALVPAMPVAAMLGARGIALLNGATRAASSRAQLRRWSPRRWRLGGATLAALALVASCSGVAVAIIGPDNPTWATGLVSSENLMQGVDDMGSNSATLNYVFQGGDQSWNWLNRHLPSGGRVATLDVRNYYFARPSELFYLDGIEAAPLLTLRRTTSILSFLRARDVRYVYSPSWAVQPGAAQQPLERALPLMHLLGSKSFPLVADFAVGGYNLPDAIYHVGAISTKGIATIPAALYLGARGGTPEVPLGHGVYQIPANDTQPRLFVTPSANEEDLSFRFRQPGSGDFSLNEYHFATSTWTDGVFFDQHQHSTGWRTAVIPLVGARPDHVLYFGIFSGTNPVDVRNISLRPISQPLLGVAGSVLPGSDAISIAAKDTSARLYLPARAATTSFYVHASGVEQVAFNAYDTANDHWIDGVFSFVTDGRSGWQKVTLPPSPSFGGLTEFGIYAPDSTIQIRDATSTPSATSTAGGLGSPAVSIASGSAQSELVEAPASGQSTVTFALTSSAPGTVNIASVATPSGVPDVNIPAVFTGPEVRQIALPVVADTNGVDQFNVTATMPITISRSTSNAQPWILDSSTTASTPRAPTQADFLPLRTDARLFVSSTASDVVHVNFQYESPSGAELEVNQESAGHWTGVGTFASTNGAWVDATFTGPGSTSFSEFGLFAPNSTVQVRDVTVRLTPEA
jgi:hypothetical protein